MKNQIKLGQVYKLNYDGISDEGSYYILVMNNGKKPNYVTLKNLNPQTMIDDPKWKFRKSWGFSEKVSNPQNITQEEFSKVCGSGDFTLVNPSEFESIKTKYANTLLISVLDLPNACPSKYLDNFRCLNKSEQELYTLVTKRIFPKYKSLALVSYPYEGIQYLRVSKDTFGVVARIDGEYLVDLDFPWIDEVKAQIAYASEVLNLKLIKKSECKSQWAQKTI